MIHSTFAKLALVSLALGAVAAAQAQTVAYSNKPAGNYYTDPYSGFGQGYDAPRFDVVGFRFASTATGLLSSIDVAITNALNYAGPNTFTLELHGNAVDGTIGTLLGSYAGITTGAATDGNYYSTVAATGAILTSGTEYWLVAKMGDNEEWRLTDGDSGQYGYRHNSQVAQDSRYGGQGSAAFSVSVAPVPEPASVAVLGLGALGLLRRRKA